MREKSTPRFSSASNRDRAPSSLIRRRVSWRVVREDKYNNSNNNNNENNNGINNNNNNNNTK